MGQVRRQAKHSKSHAEIRWLIAAAAVLLAGAFYRFRALDLVPLHHDEGVNGYFFLQLFRAGSYHYDPANYHGPTLYYLTLVPAVLNRLLHGVEGPSTIVLRLVPAFFGMAAILLILSLRRELKTPGSLAAGAMLAVSPAATYYSRYYIHETLLMFFTFGVAMTALRMRRTGSTWAFMFFAATAAMMLATKETAVLSLAVLAGSVLLVRLAAPLLRDERERIPALLQSADADAPVAADRTQLRRAVAKALACFVILYVGFYSSFGANFPRGVLDSVRTFFFWTRTGAVDNVRGPYTYLHWLALREPAIAVFSIFGLCLALVRRDRCGIFLAAWGVGILGVYSMIPYKTPWLILNILLPLVLLAGYAFSEAMAPGRPRGLHITACTLLGLLLAVSSLAAWNLNFHRYDNDAEPYVYAHTRRDALRLVATMEHIANSSGSTRRLTCTVMTPNYWPLPWYMRDYPSVVFLGHPTATDAQLILAEESQTNAVLAATGSGYVLVDRYDLRPGIRLVLLVRR